MRTAPRTIRSVAVGSMVVLAVGLPAFVLPAQGAGQPPAAVAAGEPRGAILRAAADVPDPTPAVIPAATWKAYRKAITDAAVAEPSEVVDNLILLSRSDPRVQWQTFDGEDYVLVATMRRNAITDVAVGQRFTLSGDRWVVIPRQAAAKCDAAGCARMTDPQLDQRLKQLFGLPPDADYRMVNWFWVRPADLFRPCTDPRLTSPSCPDQVVTGDVDPPVPAEVQHTDLSTFLWVQTNYAWRMPAGFDPATAVSCAVAWQGGTPCYGFPWTRLGYTYDWTDDRRDVGLTEFVAAAGAPAYLEKVGGQRDFFPAAAPDRTRSTAVGATR